MDKAYRYHNSNPDKYDSRSEAKEKEVICHSEEISLC